MGPVVVVRPLSGYANRLQAIVSGALLAEDLDTELLVCWDESEVAPVPASTVLGPAWCSAHLRSAQEVVARFGVDPRDVPPYLSVRDNLKVVTLAGLDLGEQHFMPALREVLQRAPETRAVVLSAGGKFTLSGDAVLRSDQDADFRGRRYEAYAELPLHPDIEAGAAVAALRQPFVGLHLRYSDRSTQTPWPRQIAPALHQVANSAETRSVFIASDTPSQRERWSDRVDRLGLEPWSADPGSYPRSDPRSAIGALVDWRILTRSQALVYFAASSFAEEAAVASGNYDRSVGLEASAARSAWVRAGQYAAAARTYPRRHGWFTG